MRLSTRFAVCFAVLVPLLVLLSGLFVLRLMSEDLYAERDRQLTARLHALTPMASLYAARTDPGMTPGVFKQRLAAAATGGGPGGVYLEVSGTEPLAAGDLPRGPYPAGADGPADLVRDGRRWRFVQADLGPGGRARLWLFEPAAHVNAQRRQLARRVVLSTLVAAGVGVAAGLALGRLAVRPVAVLHRQARAIDRPSRTATRLATTSRAVEVDELAGLVNELLDRRDAAVARTGEALETARAFAASAAHELRTPLTSMGANLSLLDHPGLDPAERAEVVADLNAEHARILRLITMLSGLARGELLDRATFVEVDLAEIVSTAVEDTRRRHPHATISASVPDGLPVRGRAEGLRVIVDNLLDNAAIHGAGDQGRALITVELSAQGDDAVLSVRDAGPGIPPADRETVFARFHRRTGSPGSGLGLTLVRQQVTLHGGGVVVAEQDAGTRIDVRLPVSGGLPRRPDPGSWLGRRYGSAPAIGAPVAGEEAP
ncbi:HAMP domain-containing histidine kinase [Nonomuraea sp. SMC257]|uniref:histidine kinase n=1 Tax=Nonomuraea montanisoli TaxID=2741721 RepID=A0A7Y6IC57_9ACTN|nr:HAMP domain-containing sensor histidine kinase [Nonomuraea montanisoli]NUW35518.1 HAMP domain-containing histidine kinase [Nonomuraea montanisoli]